VSVFQLSEFLSARPEPLWQLVRQAGVSSVVAVLQGAEQEQRMFASLEGGATSPPGDGAPWSEASIARDMGVFADGGFDVVAIEDTPPMDLIRLGLPGRDEQIEQVITQLEAMGNLGVRVLCYNWMAVSSWARTSVAIPGRGGSLVTGFSLADACALPDLVPAGSVTPEQLWNALEYFLAAVLPVAEKAGVRLGMHPDDPPLPVVRNMPRIMNSFDNYRRLLALSDSPSNGVTFCQGNFALMGGDVPALIREFAGRIPFVHFRNVEGTAEQFVETFHDEGLLDMAACLRAYNDIGFDGPLRPDHVPTLYGEANARPGYESLGRLFAIGYIRGLQQGLDGS
jgi:mannonate dehydratase